MVGYLYFLKRLWPLLAYLTACEVAAIVIALIWHIKLAGTMPVCTYAMVIVLNPFILPMAEMYDPKHSKIDEALTEEAKKMAEQVGIDPIPVRVLTGRQGKDVINAYYKDGSIFVTQKAVEDLSPAAVRFLIGHETGHLEKLKQRKERGRSKPAVFLTGLFFAFFTVALIGTRLFSSWVSSVLMFAPLLVIGIILTRQLQRPINSEEIELYCDQKGAELCGDPAAAYEALDKVTEKQTARAAKATGYPTRDERLAQIQAMML